MRKNALASGRFTAGAHSSFMTIRMAELINQSLNIAMASMSSSDKADGSSRRVVIVVLVMV